LAPPFVIADSEIDELVARFARALEATTAQVESRSTGAGA